MFAPAGGFKNVTSFIWSCSPAPLLGGTHMGTMKLIPQRTSDLSSMSPNVTSRRKSMIGRMIVFTEETVEFSLLNVSPASISSSHLTSLFFFVDT